MLYPVRSDPLRAVSEALQRYVMNQSLHPGRRLVTVVMAIQVIVEVSKHS